MNLKDFTDIEEAKSFSTITPRLMSADMLTSYIDSYGVLIHFQDSTKSAERGVIMAIGAGAEFNFTAGHVVGDKHLARLDDIINDVDLPVAQKPLMAALKQGLTEYCTKETKPFEAATQAQFNAAKWLFKSVVFEYSAGENIVLTLNTALSERVAATVWCVDADFEVVNAGRNVHVQNANKYRIDMIGKKSGTYEVRVPLLDADFTVELV